MQLWARAPAAAAFRPLETKRAEGENGAGGGSARERGEGGRGQQRWAFGRLERPRPPPEAKGRVPAGRLEGRRGRITHTWGKKEGMEGGAAREREG